MDQTQKNRQIILSKRMRKDLDEVCLGISREVFHYDSRSRVLATTKIEEAIMWLGMDLKELNDGKPCYEHSYDETKIANERIDCELWVETLRETKHQIGIKPRKSRERSTAQTKIEEAMLWLQADEKALDCLLAAASRVAKGAPRETDQTAT